MTTISTRLSQEELDYLTKVAVENNLLKSSSKAISIGKSMKEIIKWCHKNNIDIKNNTNSINDNTKKMIEQIHTSIPNLMYLARLDLLLKVPSIPDEEIARCVSKTIDYLNDSCGDFQNMSYNEIRFSINELGIKQTPVDKEKSLWKSR